jgi:hypothetical protein
MDDKGSSILALSAGIAIVFPYSYERTELHIGFSFFGHEPSSWFMRISAR